VEGVQHYWSVGWAPQQAVLVAVDMLPVLHELPLLLGVV